ncbi:MAG: glycosyltransferase family 9 protein [Candidatus Kapabacteria bacterium]|nr:glycosyltransferase family 9 protein [Candidatus Kapabacteria bacterium]
MHRLQALDILQSAQRIGIVRTDRLGDMILTLPLADALKQRFPAASVEMIARRYAAPCIENLRCVDAIHFTDEQPVDSLLRAHRFDALFFPRITLAECRAAWSAGVPLRIGSAFRWYSPLLLSYRIRDHRKTAAYHEAEYNVRMLSAITGEHMPPRLVAPALDPASVQSVNRILSDYGIARGERFIVIHPGSGGSAKDWQPENMGIAASTVARRHGVRVVLTGIESERDLCLRAAEHCDGAVNLCGRLTLRQMIVLLERSALLVANSTGTLHIAAALGTPVVGLYPNSPAISAHRWGPYSFAARVVSPPDQPTATRDDMTYISMDDVLRAMDELLA